MKRCLRSLLAFDLRFFFELADLTAATGVVAALSFGPSSSASRFRFFEIGAAFVVSFAFFKIDFG